ncbi:Hypoxia up-regulated protein 1 [Fulvia fulva]|uniref:Hypoxia up-regulated protein 1 n=1 Tax=Passalora fulva TaxID=5499 RepID=A0A9Q8P4X9_PASFU|nr:Hypoxia up-regulated protein 1 [Fulvia fulva]KAK4632055.1 Hypoxia up-regulated protein 1 [Fulvia fulva]KAK4633006.1 Hypoxia up-regulated protein 1 [Fulvia fulva]UJO13306.1 Hypoxia up-regulated protein 1 [Fulvia fulva]WPV11777.1 Hypoxia up-regulated protein 1 [Fulvia fulva]WPV25516.1 Hypoxia up-regulated protein 1 [Fulvia fulva]
MILSGRRRAGAMSPLALCLSLLLFISSASAAVLGIDFGTEHIKAVLVKPGIPFDIVLTKDSKRKEVAAVAFKPTRDAKGNFITEAGSYPERAYGGDALSLQGRFPGEVFPNLKFLLGIPSGNEGQSTTSIYKERYPGLQLQASEELGTTVIKSSAFPEDERAFSVEELVAMQLANIKRNAQNMAGKGSSVDDVVVTIPPFYTADERQAIMKAAGFAGFQVNGLISDGLAVGLDYAKPRTFPEVTKGEQPEYHMVFDMGAGSTTATIMRFQSRSVKDTGRFNKTVQEVAVVGAGWDRTLGGDALNHVIVDDYVKKLLTKPALKSRGTTEDEIKQNGRIMARFWKEAERARQILSANSEVNSGFEEIMPDIDFRTKMSRTEFEKLTESFADRVQTPIKDALKMADLKVEDLNSVILHGGAVRTPFVQTKLQGAVDDQAKLRSNVNADESAVFGAAFKAAALSPSFKVKEIRDSDVAGYAATLVYDDQGKERRKPLFEPNSPVGSGSTTKQVSFKDKEDFSFGFVQNVGGVDRPTLRVQSSNLTASVEELIRIAGCGKESIDTKFSVRLGLPLGLPDVTGGSVSCEVDPSKKTGSIGDSVKGWLGFGKGDQQPLDDEADGPVEQVDAKASASSGSAASSSTAAASSSKAPEPPKKQTEVIPLKWTSTTEGNPQPAPDAITQVLQRLKDFDLSDKARYARDEAQNVLESYTYTVRDFLENKVYEKVSTKEQRDLISSTLQSTKEWMESGDLSKASTETLKEKREALKKLVEPIQLRLRESTGRSETVEGLQKSLDKLQKGILRLESAASKAAASIASAATASSETSTTAGSKAPSDLDELEGAETETSPTPSETPAAINPYEGMDLTTVNETYNSISTWLKETIAEQEKLKPYEDPVFLSRDAQRKSEQIARALEDLVQKTTKAKAAKAKKPKTTKSKTTKPSKATADRAADGEEPVPADAAPEDSSAAKQHETHEAADPEAAEAPEQKPVKGGESIEDMLKWMKKDGKKETPDREHEEL